MVCFGISKKYELITASFLISLDKPIHLDCVLTRVSAFLKRHLPLRLITFQQFLIFSITQYTIWL